MKYNKKKLWLLVPLLIFVALLAVFIKDIVNIFPLITSKSEDSVRAALDTLGMRGGIVICFIVAVQLLIVFIPCEFMEIMAGITYGPIWGSIICLAGVFVGASIIYAVVNVCNLKIEKLFGNSKSYDTIMRLNNSSKSVGKFLLILFFLPAIPIGLICYFGSSTNINYFRYILVTCIGCLPSIIIDSVLGYVFIAAIGKYFVWILLAIIVVTVLALIIMKKVTTNKINKKIYGTTKPTMEMILKERKLHEPSTLFHKLLLWLGKIHYKRKYNVVIDNSEIKDLKSPFIVLSPHGCYADFVLATMAIKPNKAHIMTNVYYMYKPPVKYILDKVQAIPKKLFYTDVKSIKDCMQVVKQGRSIIMMPEARLSVDGSNQPLPGGLDKLLKKLEVPIVVLQTRGAYLSMGKWMKKHRRGRIDVKAKLLFTADQVKANSADVILNKVEKALAYNDFKWQAHEQVAFKGSNMLGGIENLLYLCPNCNSEYTLEGNKNNIRCTHCGLNVEMDNYYNFVNPPKPSITNIQRWYRYQVQDARRKYGKDAFNLQKEVVLKTYNPYGKGLDVVGEGLCTLNSKTLRYDGTLNGEEHTLEVPLEQLPALPFGCGEDWELYWDNRFYYFVPKHNAKQCVQWSIYADVAHEKLTKQ